MPHPENAFAFNEHSLQCCANNVRCPDLVELLEYARAWRLHESAPLIARLKVDPAFGEVQRAKRYRDNLLVLLASDVNRPQVYDQVTERVQYNDATARGLTVAFSQGGFLLSWPCGCGAWINPIINGTTDPGKASVSCRHVGSEDNLRLHWMSASRAAKKPAGRPKSVLRVDNAQNTSRGEVPQIHFKDGSALNVDGAWKHESKSLNDAECRWLASVGWVIPEVR